MNEKVTSSVLHTDAFTDILAKVTIQSKSVFIGRLMAYVLTIGSGILLARVLGPEALGQFTLGFLVVQTIGTVCKLGYESSMVRFIPIQDLQMNKKLIKDGVSVSLAVSLITGIAIFVFSDQLALALFHSKEMNVVLRTFSILLPIFSLYGVLSSSIRGLNRADVEYMLTNVVTPLVFVIGLVPMFLIGQRLLGVVWVRILSYLIPLLLIVFFLMKSYPELVTARIRQYDVRELIRFSLPMLFIGLMYFLLGQIDIMMLGFFKEADQVGVYSVAVRIATMIAMGLEVVSRTFEPDISGLTQRQDIVTLGSLFKVLTKWIFYLSLMLTSLVLVFRVDMLKVFGSSFVAGATALMILSIGQLINAVTGPTGKILVMSGKQKWEVLNSIITIVLNIALNFVLIPKYGINGAAVATAVSVSIINVFKLLEVYKEFKIHPYSVSYYKGIVAIAAAAASVIVIRQVMEGLHINYIITMVCGAGFLALISWFIMQKLHFELEDHMIFRKIKFVRQ